MAMVAAASGKPVSTASWRNAIARRSIVIRNLVIWHLQTLCAATSDRVFVRALAAVVATFNMDLSIFDQDRLSIVDINVLQCIKFRSCSAALSGAFALPKIQVLG
jgi:hypothetical protein